jgi:hypothetical protein
MLQRRITLNQFDIRFLAEGVCRGVPLPVFHREPHTLLPVDRKLSMIWIQGAADETVSTV